MSEDVPELGPNATSKSGRLTGWGWFAVVVLIGLLIWAVWYAASGWGALAGVHVSTMGWVFIAAGVLFTLALGGGLMALVFYSSRHDYDR